MNDEIEDPDEDETSDNSPSFPEGTSEEFVWYALKSGNWTPTTWKDRDKEQAAQYESFLDPNFGHVLVRREILETVVS